jgi:hypothetical protein
MGITPTVHYAQDVFAVGHGVLVRNEIIIDAHGSTRLYFVYSFMLRQSVEAKSTACIDISAQPRSVNSLLGSIVLDSHACCKVARRCWISRGIATNGQSELMRLTHDARFQPRNCSG